MYVKVFEDGFVAYLWITLGYRDGKRQKKKKKELVTSQSKFSVLSVYYMN